MFNMAHSPYLQEKRLANVMAAIQVMATYKFYKLDFKGWADRISGNETEEKKWKKIFKEHPEFFRLDQSKTKASLVWRRNYPKRYDVDKRKEISKEEFYELSDEDKERISRIPLKNEDVSMLVESAINLHYRAFQLKQDRRWWIPLLIGLLVGLVPFFSSKCAADKEVNKDSFKDKSELHIEFNNKEDA